MRLISGDGLIDIVFDENVVNTVVIEKPELFGKYINDIVHQCEGNEGNFVLSDTDKLINISKKMFTIINPFSVNINEKRILTKIHKDITSIVSESFSAEYAGLNSVIISFLDSILVKLPYYLDYDVDADVSGLIKHYDVKLTETDLNFFDKLLEYLKVMRQILGYEICVFVNLKSFITEKQLNDLLEFCCYNKLNIILLESLYRPITNIYEHCKIIDKDFCIIDT